MVVGISINGARQLARRERLRVAHPSTCFVTPHCYDTSGCPPHLPRTSLVRRSRRSTLMILSDDTETLALLCASSIMLSPSNGNTDTTSMKSQPFAYFRAMNMRSHTSTPGVSGSARQDSPAPHHRHLSPLAIKTQRAAKSRTPAGTTRANAPSFLLHPEFLDQRGSDFCDRRARRAEGLARLRLFAKARKTRAVLEALPRNSGQSPGLTRLHLRFAWRRGVVTTKHHGNVTLLLGFVNRYHHYVVDLSLKECS